MATAKIAGNTMLKNAEISCLIAKGINKKKSVAEKWIAATLKVRI